MQQQAVILCEGFDDVLRAVAARRHASSNVDSGAATIDGVEVASLVWGCDDEPGLVGVPRQQCLERLVSAAIVAADPARGASVAEWLNAAPVMVGPTTKAHAYAYLAKWFAGSGCEDFFRAMWREPAIRVELENRLRASGSQEVIAALLEP